MDGLKIEILMDATGKLMVNGPIDNKVVCLGMLEFAKAVILTHRPGAANTPGILLARGELPPGLNGGPR